MSEFVLHPTSVPQSGSAVSPWEPARGPVVATFTTEKIKSSHGRLSPGYMETVVDEALDILGHCASPVLPEATSTVLVVGNVQSGKTMSFTTLAALANDNGYGLVVVLAGTTKNLEAQSEQRLAKDLTTDSSNRFSRSWRLVQRPNLQQSESIRNSISGWKKHRAGETHLAKPALLVTVLKHSKRIDDAAALFRALKSSFEGVPTIIIDDESDQASLNTYARQNLTKGTDKSSSTYDSIRQLREALPNHSYVQYTATPQANLLLAMTDVLDPDFVKVISTGDSYTGGDYFFRERSNELIVKLSNKDICDPKGMPTEPPASLREALMYFLLGVAATANQGWDENRSMMIQASQNTAPHQKYDQWIGGMLGSWPELAADSGTELYDDFRRCYDSLQKSCGGSLADFQNLITLIPELCHEVQCRQVNSTSDQAAIDWAQTPYWILIGGQKLDRGFTVEGLTVTYMPRRLADNADTLQQRARFFGYRDEYAGLCRIFLPDESITAFQEYVKNEEGLRRSLATTPNGNLREWKRQFFLSKKIRHLTRLGVVGRKHSRRISLDDGWRWFKYLDNDIAIEHNNNVVDSLVRVLRETTPFEEMSNSEHVDRRAQNRNMIARDCNSELLESLVVSLRLVDVTDRTMATAVSMLVENSSTENVDIVLMSNLVAIGDGRSADDIRTNIFTGQNPKGNPSPESLRYSGDRKFYSPDRITVQLRNQRVRVDSEVREVRWIAFHFPESLASDLVIEIA